MSSHSKPGVEQTATLRLVTKVEENVKQTRDTVMRHGHVIFPNHVYIILKCSFKLHLL